MATKMDQVADSTFEDCIVLNGDRDRDIHAHGIRAGRRQALKEAAEVARNLGEQHLKTADAENYSKTAVELSLKIAQAIEKLAEET